MANFQFGQDNVGSNWQVPSWYVQGMSQSPMAASIAGIGNSIAAFASGYQAAKQAERNYGTEQKKLTIQEEEAKARKDYYDYLKGQKTQSAAADNTAVNWFSSLPENYSKFQEWKRLGMPSASGGSVANPTRSPAIFQDPNLTPAGSLSYGLPTMQGGFPVNPEALTGYQ